MIDCTRPRKSIGALFFVVAMLVLMPETSWASSVKEFVTPTHEGSRAEDALSDLSGPYGITAGPDQALWFTENGANQVGRVTTDGQFTEFAIEPPARGLLRITTGSDDALWFTEYAAGKIGRITTAGIVSEFELPSPDAMPSGIVAGPDGALWFTEAAANKIGRITTDGSISEFAVPTADSVPWGIAASPDGALWFTEYGANKIGRITTDGAVTEYEVPTPLSLPSGITAGPDGALWFTENNGSDYGPEDLNAPGKIGRLTTDGIFSEFQIPIGAPNEIGGAAPTAIVAGPDGALWFTAMAANEIVRVTTSGNFGKVKIPTSTSAPEGIAVGPDRKLWFTEINTSRVGALTPSRTATKKPQKAEPHGSFR